MAGLYFRSEGRAACERCHQSPSESASLALSEVKPNSLWQKQDFPLAVARLFAIGSLAEARPARERTLEFCHGLPIQLRGQSRLARHESSKSAPAFVYQQERSPK